MIHGMPTSSVIPRGTSESASCVGDEMVVIGDMSFGETGNFPSDDFVLVVIVSVDFFDLRVAVDVVLPLFRC